MLDFTDNIRDVRRKQVHVEVKKGKNIPDAY